MRKLAWLAMALSCACSGMHAREKTEPRQAAQPAPPPVASEWDQRISSEKFDTHGDRIGQASLETLAMGGPASSPKIADYLADPSPQVRAKAIEILAGFGRQAEPGLGRVHELSRDTNPTVRAAALKALALVAHPASKGAIEARLKDTDAAARIWAHAGLAKLEGDCQEHLEEIAELLGKGASPVPEEAAEAIMLLKCADEDAVQQLGKYLLGGDEATRVAAVRALGACGTPAAAQVGNMAALLEDKSLGVRLATLAALGALGPNGAGAVTALEKLLDDPAPRLRELAAITLGQIGPAASAARAGLKKLENDPVDTVQAAAKRALKQIGGE